MGARTRGTLAAVTAGAALLSLAACSPGQQGRQDTGKSRAERQQRIAWKPCPADVTEGAPKGAECGTVRVPVDWTAPGGEKLDVAVVRRKATHRDRRIGTLMFLPGGPGNSGVQNVAQTKEWGGAERRFDIVSFDPRGTGLSSPVQCPAGPLAEMIKDKRFATTPEGFGRLKKRATALAAGCARTSGAVAKHTDAGSVGRDMDVIRAALGEDRISLYGHSYGTVYGQRYAATHGDRVRAAVLDGVMDPAIGRRAFGVTGAKALEGAFGEFARWCERTRDCELGERDAWRVYEGLAERAAAGKLRNGGKDVPLAELNGTIDAMLLTPSWPAVAQYLDALDTGRPWETDDGDVPADEKTLPGADLSVCADLNLRAPDAATHLADQRAARAAAPRFGYSPNTVSYANLCQGLPAPSAAATKPVRTDTPLLLIGARHDNATPLDWARSVQRRFGDRAALVEVKGWGHAVKIFNGGAERDTIMRYLTDLDVPKPGTVVEGGMPPGA
ncbi:alpha/beta fold hydrolase [Streptomyces sp. KL118A]|uniref:alpha/beta fold hydrolase n=1 Tax=Streptomyces sp. KL118A TaxID=3045153 RepID=UPI00278C5531|nr:alpha/beta fold hydrolase [Streptomyces sp. KL118A]